MASEMISFVELNRLLKSTKPEELAKQLNIPLTMIDKWVRGAGRPNARMVLKLRKLLSGKKTKRQEEVAQPEPTQEVIKPKKTVFPDQWS